MKARALPRQTPPALPLIAIQLSISAALTWDETYTLLVARGVNVLEKPLTTFYNMRRFTIADPDGYNLTFQGPIGSP
jgi:uncharacterized glyoxalase superfamily protein PhnB